MIYQIKKLLAKPNSTGLTQQQLSKVERSFDEEFYLKSNPDVAEADVDPFKHFLEFGWREERDPNDQFSISEYLNLHSDVRTSGMNPFVHYQLYGINERRKLRDWQPENVIVKSEERIQYEISTIEPHFDKAYYIGHYSECLPSSVEPIEYFVKEGVYKLHNPNADFCTERYVAQQPTLSSEENAFLHFLVNKDSQEKETLLDRRNLRQIAKSEFDANYYIKKYPDISSSKLDPLDHFLQQGWREYRNPCEWFDTRYYVETYANKIGNDTNPFIHYLRTGRELGLKTSDERLGCNQNLDESTKIDLDLANQAAMEDINEEEEGEFVSDKSNKNADGMVSFGLNELRSKVFQNYGINPDSKKESPLAFAVLDGYDQSTEELSGFLCVAAEAADDAVALVIYPDVVTVDSVRKRRPDVEKYFNIPMVLGIKFHHENNRNQMLEVQNKLDSVADSTTSWTVGDVGIFWNGTLTKANFVNAIDEDNLKLKIGAKHLSDLVNLGDNTKYVSVEAQIGKISEHIDVKHYSTQSRLDFDNARSAAIHYFKVGAQQQLNPTAWFNTGFYSQSPNATADGLNPFFHYLSFGRNCGVHGKDMDNVPTDPIGIQTLLQKYFDENYYYTEYPDVLRAGMDAFTHFIEHGWIEKRNPSAEFDTSYYLDQNPDVREAQINPFVHYVITGRSENRRPHPEKINLDVSVAHDPRRQRQIVRIPGESPTRTEIKSPKTSLRIAVHVHMHYEDEFKQICKYLNNIPASFHLQITTSDEGNIDIINSVLTENKLNAESTAISVLENRGRDVWPMISWLMEDADKYDLVLHMHTKKSAHLGDYAIKWANHIYSNLVGSSEAVSSIISYFENNLSCGIMYPVETYSHKKYLNWGLNKPIAEKLFSNLGLDVDALDELELDFPAGNMFWFRPSAIKPLFNGSIEKDMFPSEPILTDGTIAHAIERCLPYVAHCNSFETFKIETVSTAYMPLNKPSLYMISIIVPVYNCADWLHNTVGSIVNQGALFPNIEIILIDNNSTDDSAIIARHYADTFSNIVFEMEPRQGAGNARNKGIDLARGQYIAFLDSDDILVDNSIEGLYSLASSSDADVVVSKLRFFDLDGFGSAIPYSPSDSHGKVFDINKYCQGVNNYKIDDDELEALRSVFNDFGPCAKLYRRQFLQNNNIVFPEDVNYEDNIFVYKAYLASKRLVISDAVTYLYRRTKQRENTSQSMRTDEKTISDASEVYRTLIDMCTEIENTYLQKVLLEALGNRLQSLFENPDFGSRAYEIFRGLIKENMQIVTSEKIKENS